MIPRFALIIGAMKSGTTSLYEYLCSHPEICRCRLKEPDFFTLEENWSRGLGYYEQLWKWNPGSHKVALEASTNYTKIPRLINAAERIASIRLPARFIYVMRDPIARIESHYTHALSAGWLDPPPPDKVDEHSIAVSSYARQLAEYYRRFPAADILLLKFEDLILNPREVVQKAAVFLGVDPSFDFQAIGGVHNPNRGRLIEDHPLYKRWSRLAGISSLASRAVPARLRAFIRGRIGKRIEKSFALNEEQKLYVRRSLREDQLRLRIEFGVDPSGWDVGLED